MPSKRIVASFWEHFTPKRSNALINRGNNTRWARWQGDNYAHMFVTIKNHRKKFRIITAFGPIESGIDNERGPWILFDVLNFFTSLTPSVWAIHLSPANACPDASAASFFLNNYHWLRLIIDVLCCWKRSDNPSLSSLKLYDVWLPFQERQIDHRLQCHISGLWVRLSGNQKLLCERKNAESDPHPCHPFRFKWGKWTEKNAVKLSFSKTGETV